jgi:hypothetical protein
MTWTLVLVNLIFVSGFSIADAELIREYDTFQECFAAREELILDMGSLNGYPLENTQVVCIKTLYAE